MNDGIQLAIVFLFFIVVALWSKRRDRQERPPGMMWRFWPHTLRAFSGWNCFFYIVAAGVTCWMVTSGIDRSLQDWWQTANPLGRTLPWAMLVGGNFWTLIAAFVIFLVGRRRENRELLVAGVTSMQAILSAFVITHTLKVLTGRHGPLDPSEPHHAPFPKVEDAADFAFDFWNHTHRDGRFFWPSGHTLSSMTFVTALVAYYPHKRWIPLLGYPFVLFMAISMVEGDFHWVSDVVAAFLIGFPVGWVIGGAIRAEDRRRLENE